MRYQLGILLPGVGDVDAELDRVAIWTVEVNRFRDDVVVRFDFQTGTLEFDFCLARVIDAVADSERDKCRIGC
ncbi:MAG: hypothetical protein HY650_10465 [Acidobacteria bacterium]|nr:hypothetical protein [Acidobacteriota bacterium]